MTPIFDRNSTNHNSTVIGVFAQLFSWDAFFRSSLPSYIKRIDIVISTSSKTFTIAVGDGQVTIVAKADVHDTKYNKYKRSATDGLPDSFTSTVSGYRIYMYPTDDLYNQYITNTPRNVCIAVVLIIWFVVFILAVYDYLQKKREKTLISAAETAENAAKSVRNLLPRFMSSRHGLSGEEDEEGGFSLGIARQLERLPVHKAILDDVEGAELLKIVNENLASAKEKFRGKTAFELALELDDHNIDLSVIAALVENSLPYDPQTKQPIAPEQHGYTWVQAVQYDKFETIITNILAKYPVLSRDLAVSTDSEGRQAVNVASPRCKKVILRCMYFHRRYEIEVRQ
jgi:hypothetical protein